MSFIFDFTDYNVSCNSLILLSRYLHIVPLLISIEGATTKDFRWSHSKSEVFLTKNYCTEWRDHSRWYMYIKFVHKTFSFRKHSFNRIFEHRNFVTKCLWCQNILWLNLMYQDHPYTCLHSVRSLNLINIAKLLWYGTNSYFCNFTCNEALCSMFMLIYWTRFSQFFFYIIELRKKKYAVMWCNVILRNYMQT